MREFIRAIRAHGRRDVGGAWVPIGDVRFGRWSLGSHDRIRRGLLGGAALLMVGGLTLGLAQAPVVHAAPGATFTVTDCTSANANVTSPDLNLDTALSRAEQSGPFPTTITFSCSGDIALDQTLDLTDTTHSLTIDGSGQTVTLDGGGALRVLSVSAGASLNLNAVTIAHGNGGSAQDFPNGSGGGLSNQGGTVSISNSAFSNNSVNGLSYGGGLCNCGSLGTVSIANTVFSGNTAGIGGGLYDASSGGSVTISNSSFTNNASDYTLSSEFACGICVGGGGLANAAQSGSVSIVNSVFSGNTSSGSVTPNGGGIANDAGTVNITNSTFSGNSAAIGEGVYNLRGTVSVTGSTFSEAGTSGGDGIGLDNEQGTATITNSTFSGNRVGFDSDIGTATVSFSTFSGNGTGLVTGGSGSVSVGESIIAGNSLDAECTSGSITDQGYNLAGFILTIPPCNFTSPSDIQGDNPLLATSLANNGGPTPTLALLIGSPAIDGAPIGACPQYDQRGVLRLDNGESTCDIGAYEYVDPSLASTPSPSAVTLGATSPVILKDSATLANATNPTGTIAFTLKAPGGGTIDTETVSVSGDGTYTTPTGYALPTNTAVTGAYQWNAVYTSGDSNNYNATAPAAQATVSKASPLLATTATPSSAAAGATLKDTADLAGGYFPTGSITFTLTDASNHTVDTETVNVSGDGTYTTGGYTVASTGSYQWHASYSGDGNNSSASDVNDAAAEQVTVSTVSTTTNLAATSPAQPSGLPAGIAVSMAGQSVTFTATISPNPGGGTASFTDGATTLCSNVLVSSGKATCSTTYTTVGKHTITATYSGSGGYLGSSASLTLYVDTDISRYLKNGVYNLSNIKLPGASFIGENLCGANLSNSNFSGANFSYANLCGANLSDGNFSSAIFTGAKLSGANLTLANLKGATGLASATLSAVIWSNTTCPDNTNSNNDGGTCVGHL